MSACAVAGCHREPNARYEDGKAYCRPHAVRYERYGDPEATPIQTPAKQGTTPLLVKLGVTYRELDYWIRTGRITIRGDVTGSGLRREIADDETQAIAVMVTEYRRAQAIIDRVRSGEVYAEALTRIQATETTS